MATKELRNMKVEECREKLNNVGTWIGSADNKISIGLGIFSITGLFIGFIFSENFERLMYIKNINFEAFLSVMIFFVLSLVLFVCSLCFYVYGIVPRLCTAEDFKRKKAKEIKSSINFWFYKHVASFKECSDFIEACESKFGPADTECKQVLEEVYANSNICLIKMQSFKIGIVISLFSVLFSVVSVLTLIISCVTK